MFARTAALDEAHPADDAGMGLVEVLVAMLVFAIVALSVAYSLTFTLANTRDSKARQIALNLASQEIDKVRAIGDPFKVLTETTPVTQDGETYSIQRSTSWISTAGTDAPCSIAAGTLQYKRVNVTVTWTNMGPTGIPARTDTLLAPASRINDPAKGTLLVSIKGADGLGEPGVSFTITPGTGVALEPTDAEGCSFVLGVAPGTYTVRPSRPNYLDIDQVSAPTKSVVIVAGASASAAFQYDLRGTFPLRYASNALRLPTQTPAVPARRIEYPNELVTTFINSNGVWAYPSPVVESAVTAPAAGIGSWTKELHPWQIGYQAFAGPTTATCTVHDPQAWPPTTATPPLVGSRSPLQSAAPGGTSTDLDVPMGLVDVLRPSGSANDARTFLIAVRQSAPVATGQPACTGSTLQYNFGSVLASTTVAARVALPFGSWKLYAVTATATATPAESNVLKTGVTLRTPGVVPNTDGGFALDPRGVAP
ncbi:type II secretory pathway pseudopilin PulG [Agromyces terreus]|uniref:Type II secretory pathway pseudopilin PulG n=1 Tax=Agromyces terreus TaxID=424795 RepID=A0A9X2GXW0_9MICO|nr:prepilin-type N-terminal cleavage/methylation domain-containing protein [Agromyces terreus]MCP2371085.1 type II secretory pathway pseudopilin PulG [Agromyces terreus]